MLFRFFLILFLLTGVTVAGCNTPPRIVSATLGTSVQGSKIVLPQTTFKPGDRMIHLVVDVENVLTDTNIAAKWYKVGSPDELLLESDLALDAFNTFADYTLTSMGDWQPGNYKVVVYLDGKEDRQVNFTIE
jgi:hypothetical protein